MLRWRRNRSNHDVPNSKHSIAPNPYLRRPAPSAIRQQLPPPGKNHCIPILDHLPKLPIHLQQCPTFNMKQLQPLLLVPGTIILVLYTQRLRQFIQDLAVTPLL